MQEINVNNLQSLKKRYDEFTKMMQGKDPSAVLNELISSGKVTQAQLDDAKRKVEALKMFL